MSSRKWHSYTVTELVKQGMLERPLDGNHGAIHPKSCDYVPFGVPFIMATDLQNGTIDFDKCSHITEKQAASLKKGFAKPGDVLLTHKATIGRTAIVSSDYPTIVLTPQVTYYRVKEGILNIYLKYYFDTPQFQDLLRNWSGSGSTRSYIGITEQGKLPVIVPPLPEQRAIAATLSCLDDKIELNNRMNKTLEAMAQAIFKSWFVDFEPFQDGEFVDSELGRIPKGWRVGTLGEFFPIITGKKNANIASDKGTYPFFSCSQTISYTDDFSFDANAILVAGNGDFNVKSYNGKFEAYQRTYVLIPYDKLLVGFLYYAMKYFLNDITSGYRGSVIKFITKSNLQDYKLALPPSFSNIEAITTMQSILSSIAETERQTQMFVKIRDSILPKLMSGEIRIPMEV